MSAPPFHTKAVSWLRESQGFSAPIRPGEILDEGPNGGAHVRGYFSRPSSAGTWGFAALCAWTLGAVLMMFHPPGTSAALRNGTRQAGYVVHAAGIACLVVSESKRRRNRSRALVEVRGEESQAATRESVLALSSAGSGASTWLVTEHEPAAEVLAAAEQSKVRCFVSRGRGFVELGSRPDPVA